MKDIYELLSESNIDISENEEMEVSELERERGKKKLLNSIKKKKRSGEKVAIAASVAIIIGISSIFVAKPTWASNIPIIGDLIQNNLIEVNSKYKDYIQAVGQTKSDEGIDITFESAIADNNILNLSFVVKNTNESIEDNFVDAMLIPTSLKVNGKSVSTAAGGSFEIIDENTVRVLKNISWEYNELPNKLNMDIEISELFGKTGNWDVNFALDVEEIRKDTYVEKLDKVINANGIDFNLTEVIMTPLTTSIKSYYKYNGGDSENINFIVIDGDGNGVRQEGYGGGNTMLSKRFEQSYEYTNNVDTKILNIIPFYRKNGIMNQIENEEKLKPISIDIENFSKANLKINEYLSMDINNVIVDGEYLIVKYSERYLDAKMYTMYLGHIYINIDGKDALQLQNYNDEYKEKSEELYRKYADKNRYNRIEIVKIGDSKDIEIGAYDGSSIEILKDEAFTVTKK